MNLMSLMARLSLDSSEYKQGLMDSQTEAESAGSKIGKALGTISKAVAGAAAAGAAAVGKLTYDAVNSYADYEQLIGGVETLFKDSADIVSQYADNAYKTAGLSANAYMETVTSFSASLLQSLDGDTAEAAEMADMAIIDMSDNANKMGTSMEAIQNAYQGFAKNNYTMLDNLKLGYGGTKTEMERLILDAEALDDSFRAVRDTNGDLKMAFSDVVEAIHIVQTDMNITGTTAKEAASTIEGSVASMQAAWKNMITGFGNSSVDMSELVDNFTGSLETAMDNILPVVETALTNMSDALPRLVSNLLPKLSQVITNMLPNLVTAVTNLVSSLGNALPGIVKGIVNVMPSILQNLFSNIGTIAGELLPALAESFGNVLLNLPSLLVSTVSGVVDGIANLFTGIADAISEAVEPRFADSSIFAGTFAQLETNWQSSVSDASNNMKMAWATAIGDQDWVDALEGLELAKDLSQKIYDEWETFVDDMAEWSPEAAKVKAETIINTIATMTGALEAIIDENGVVTTGQESLAQQLVDQINEQLGEETLTLEEKSLAQEIVTSVNNSYAKGASWDDLVDQLESDMKTAFPELDSEGTIGSEEVYNIMWKATNAGMTYDETISDSDKWKEWVKGELKAAGYTNVDDIEAVASFMVSPEGAELWYNGAPSTGVNDSVFVDWLKTKCNLDDPIDWELVAKLAVKYTDENGEVTDIEAFKADLVEYTGLTEEQANQAITYTVTGIDQLNDASKALEELIAKEFALKQAEIAIEKRGTTYTDQAEAYRQYTEAQNAFVEALNNGELGLAETLYDQVIESKSAMDATTEAASQAAEALAVAQYNATVGIGEQVFSLEQIPEDVRQIYQNMVDGYVQAGTDMSTVNDQILQDSYDLATAQAENGKQVEGQVKDVTAALEEEAVASGKVLDTFNGFSLEQVASAFDLVGESARGSYSDIMQWVLDPNNMGFQQLADSWGLSIGELAEILAQYGVDMQGALDDMAGSAAHGGTDIADALIDSVKNAQPEWKSASADIQNDWGSMLGSVQADTEKTASNAMAGFAQNIRNKIPNVKSAASNMESGMVSQFSGTPAKMRSKGSDSGDKMREGINSQLIHVKTVLQTMAGYFTSEMSGIAQTMLTQGTNAGANLVTGITSAQASVSAAINSLMTTITGAGGGIYNSMWNVGSNAGKGLYDGLNSWGYNIQTKAQQISNGIVAESKKALNESSPSKAMREIGAYAMEGLYLGMGDQEDAVLGEARDIANGLTGIMTDDLTADMSLGIDGYTSAMRSSTAVSQGQQAQLLQLLQYYLPLLASMDVVIDGDKQVGALLPRISRGLKDMNTSYKRGNGVYA